jgi:DNA-binding LytR/AlgR family response regulator
MNVVDYLLKPISFDRFMKAINKFHQHNRGKIKYEQKPVFESALANEFIYIKSDKKLVKIFLKDIYFFESMEDYVVVQKRDQKIITKDQIKRFEEILPENLFLRIHRSYIVSIAKIDAITVDTIEIGKRELPIGRSYKQAVQNALYRRDK